MIPEALRRSLLRTEALMDAAEKWLAENKTDEATRMFTERGIAAWRADIAELRSLN